MHDEEEPLSFNFWPSFADLMLALVLLLCLVLCLVSATIAMGTVDLKRVQQKQDQMIEVIAGDYSVKAQSLSRSSVRHGRSYGIYFRGQSPGEPPDIAFYNDLNAQRITFNDKLLFSSDQTELKDGGREVLRRVGARLYQQLASIREIQVQGHADTEPTQRHGSNIRLAAGRAIAVFMFLKDEVGIDPAEHLMSVTSFGEYLSVQRSVGEGSYNRRQLDADNESEDFRSRNRRIELVITYRR